MVLDYYARDMTLAIQASGDVMTAADLLAIAHASGLHGVGVAIEPTQLNLLSTPAILEWTPMHFVILEHAGASEITIVDPAAGRRAVATSEAIARFGGTALHFSKPSRSVLGWIIRCTSSLRGALNTVTSYELTVAVLGALVAGLLLGVAFTRNDVAPTVIAAVSATTATALSLLVLAHALEEAVTRRERLWLTIAQSALFPPSATPTVSKSNVGRWQLAAFEANTVAGSSAAKGTWTAALITGTLLPLLCAPAGQSILVHSLAVSALVLTTSLWATFIAAVLHPPESENIYWTRHRAAVARSLTGMPTFAATGTRSNVLQYVLETRRVAQSESKREKKNLGPLKWLALSALATTVVIAIEWSATVPFRQFVGACVVGLCFRAVEENMKLAASAFSPHSLEERKLSQPASSVPGALVRERVTRICVEDVKIGAAACANSPPFSLSLLEGDRLWVTGPSGSGKTMLGQIVLGILKPQSGRVLWNGIDVNISSRDSKFQDVGALLERACWYHGSIADNLRCGRSGVPDTALRDVCATLRLDVEISSLPLGLQTRLDPLGGQLRPSVLARLAIARALIATSQVYILDEPTMSLDAASRDHALDILCDLTGILVVLSAQEAPPEWKGRVLKLPDNVLI
jgi:ABC-type multidrug transport system fused ATPase/permease subunit